MPFGWKRRPKTTVPLGTVSRRRLSDVPTDTELPAMSATAPFRRNQTITGSSSASVSAVISHDTQLKSARQEAHELHRRRRSLLSLFAVTIVACVVLFIMLYESILSVDVTLYGQIGALSQSQESSFQKAVGQYFGANPLQRLRWFFSTSQLGEYLETHGHSEVNSVLSIDPKSLGSAIITLKVREPIASWTINGTEHFVDGTGAVFDANYFNSPQISIIDQTGSAPSQGVIASSNLLQFIGLATGQMKSYGYAIHQVILPPNTTREVQFVLSSGVAIKMTIDRPAGEQCEDADRALQYFAAHQITIQYVDVRVSRQAYYR